MSIGIGIGDVLKICEIAGRVYKNCRDCTGEYKSLTTEARSLSNLLEDITDKFDKIPANKQKQLEDAYEPCIDVLQELDKLLAHYNSLDTKSKRAWDRLKWDPAKSQTLRDRLTSSVTMLNSFYNSLIHDNQVLILEALERLEHDYKGGHREESIASLERITSGTLEDEEEEDEAAWTQILRDLEDVGVAKQDALSYRDVIVDWLVKAVNEGRLLEQHAEPDPFESMSRDLEPVLLATTRSHPVDAPGTHYLDVPTIFPPFQTSKSAPVSPPSPLIAPEAMSEQQRTQSIPTTASLYVPEPSRISSSAPHYSSDTDTPSEYGRPGPRPRGTSTTGSTSNQIRRVPVPVRGSDIPQSVATPDGLTASTSSSRSPASSVAAVAISDLPEVAPSTVSQPEWPAFTLPPFSVAHPASTSTSALPEPLPAPIPPQFVPASTTPQVVETPPSYYDKESTMPADLAWIAQQIMAAWARHDFVAAGRLLEEQLEAVERGQTVLTTGTQPDRRILRHLIGVCNSFTGNFLKAKTYFESVFNGIYLDRNNLDDGDIAAARWLGDVCFHLRQHCNATLAWGVAYEGSTGRYGAVRDRTRRVADELRLLDHWLFVFRRIENSFHGNLDPTDIFRQTLSPEKSNLITSLKVRLYERNGFGGMPTPPPYNPTLLPAYSIGPRQRLDMSISEGFLLSPLISISAWPLPWDPTFSPMDAAQLDRRMNTIKTTPHITPLVERTLPTLTLGDSKKLHYVTRRGSRWLIETVKQGLQEMCIEHTESLQHESIVCTLNQHRDGYAFSEGVEISFKKLQFRSVYGLKVSDVRWATRIFGPFKSTDTTDFRDILKGILENAERETAGLEGVDAGASTLRKQASFQNYR